jgi:hypothetical protein
LAARGERFREIYSALGLAVLVRADRSIEIRWESRLSEVSQGHVYATRDSSFAFRAVLMPEGEASVGARGPAAPQRRRAQTEALLVLQRFS